MKTNKSEVSRSTPERTNLRMSKSNRTAQSSNALMNWGEMVRMLFEIDPNGGRKAINRKLISLRHRTDQSKNASYSDDQIQYILFLMMIVSTAEKRIQELYRKEFAERCDAISKRYNLNENDYWTEGEEPKEWQDLNQEFEQQASRIHLDTLKEYNQHEIADMVQAQGVDQLFEIMATIRAQFITMLKNFQGNDDQLLGSEGTIPEMLQSSDYSS